MASNNKITTISQTEEDLLISKTSKALPNNPSESGWSAGKIKDKLGYLSSLYLLDLLKRDIEESNTALSNIYSDFTKYENGSSIANKAKCDQNGKVIDETYFTIDSALDKQDKLVSGTNFPLFNGTDILSLKNYDLNTGKAPDSALSNTSKNVVENQAITKGIADETSSRITGDTDNSTAISNEVTRAKGVEAKKADLDTNNKVPSAQLPSYVDDVLEYASKTSFPTTGEGGKIYVALDTNLTFRWSGSTYIEISESLALGETSSTAYAGDKGKANKTTMDSHIANNNNPHGVTKAQVGLGNCDNTSDTDKPISTATQTALDAKQDKSSYLFYKDSLGRPCVCLDNWTTH